MEWMSVMPLGTYNKVSDVLLLGQEARFIDKDYASTEGVKPTLSAIPIRARLMYNDSGSTIAPGSLLRADVGTTYGPFKAVDGTAVLASDQVPCGVADPWGGTIPVGAFFWVIYKGPCKFLFTTGTTLAPNDILITGAAARVTKYNVASETAEQNLHKVGWSLSAVDTAIASDTLFRGFANFWT